jgi:hypothetical protein
MMLAPGVDRPYGGFSNGQKRAYVCGLMACGPFCGFLSPSTVNRLFYAFKRLGLGGEGSPLAGRRRDQVAGSTASNTTRFIPILGIWEPRRRAPWVATKPA